MTEKTGTFVVTHAEEGSAVLRDVETAQVHTLASNPGLAVGEVLEGTVTPEPPLELSWELVGVEDRRRIELVDSDLEPTRDSVERVADAEVGEVLRVDRAGRGELHLLPVPSGEVETAATEVLADEETIARAARLEAVRVEVRRSADDGLVSVRYLPDHGG